MDDRQIDQVTQVANWYNQNATLEDGRLDLGRLEKAVTLRTIEATLQEITPETQRECRIADLGCGTGAYAIHLAQQGHQVNIADISREEVDLANSKAKAAGVEFAGNTVADARRLREFPDVYKPGFYDMVMALGPMYHLLAEQDRLDVLRLCLEMLKPGGFLLVAFVTKYAHLRDMAVRDPGRLHEEASFYGGYLQSGNYVRGASPVMHHADVEEIRQLLSKADARLGRLIGCEGFLGFQHAKGLAGLGEQAFKAWEELVLEHCEDPAALGASDHLLAIVRRASSGQGGKRE